jgi:hypothetical protein
MATFAVAEPLAPIRPAASLGARLQTVATWLFVLPLLTEGVAKDVVKIETAGLAVLAFVSIVILRRPIPQRAAARIFLTFAALTLILFVHLAFGSWPSNVGTTRSYDTHAMLFVITYVIVAVFAVLFFEERLFERVIWRAATLVLWIGVASCAASRLTGHLLLVNPADGGLRMVGTLTEPSDWAPVLTLVLLLALRRRSWPYVALALAGLVLADSPTCILVMAVIVPLYYVLVGTLRQRAVMMMVLALIVPAGVFFVQRTDPAAYLDSGNPAEVAVGRLVSGIDNAETDGQEGSNARFTSTTVVLAAARANGWMRFGAGLAADTTYFPAMYPDRSTTGVAYGPNALWVAILFDFGEGGVAILGVLMLAAAWRMRHFPQLTAILLPFFAAALVNSAAPDTALVALGIMLFAFGRAPFAATSVEGTGPGSAVTP